MSQELDSLTQEVHANSAVVDSAITLINGLAARIEDLKDDPTQMQALADELRAKSVALGEAVKANTPAA